MILTLTPKALDADVSPTDAALRLQSLFDMNLLTEHYMTAHESVETLARLLRGRRQLSVLLVRVGFDGDLHEVHTCGGYHDDSAMADIGGYFAWPAIAEQMLLLPPCSEEDDD